MSGTVVGSAPINDAAVHLWVLDGNGRLSSKTPMAVTQSNANGKFDLEIDLETHREFAYAPFLLLEASIGAAEEVTHPEHSAKTAPHVSVLIRGHSLIGPYTDIVISPLTTLAKELTDARLEQRKATSYTEAMEQAHQLIGEHFQLANLTRSDSHHVFGPSGISSPLDEGMHHNLILQGMTSLAHEMHQSTAGQSDIDIFALLQPLLDDIRGPGVIFDGIAGDGLPAAPYSCTPDCHLGADTLRTDLVRALARGFLRSPDSRGVNFGEAAPLLLAIASNTEPELFGDTLPAPLDDEPPWGAAVASPVVDERLDTIIFDGDTLAPQHHHDSDTVDLAQGFDGGPCPQVHKHVNLMNSPSDNPLLLRVKVSDDIVGIDDDSVFAVLYVESSGEEFSVPVRVVRAHVEGWREYEVMLLSDEVPALARREGTFRLTIHASDWLGNSEPISTCWIHTPLAPPVWVSEPRVADQADSLAMVSLISDDNNGLAMLLNGVSLDLGKAIMEFEVANGTDEPAYVTLSYAQPNAIYSKSWTDTYAELYELSNSLCVQNNTCATNVTLDTRSFHSIRGNIAELITGIRVWDVTYTPPVEIFPCDDCDVDEYYIQPRLADGVPRRYRVALITTYLPELAPVSSGEPPMLFADLPIHPVYQPMVITGHIGQTLSICETLITVECELEVVVQPYRAVTEATISAGMIEVRGQVSAAPDLSPHVPRPNAHSFGRPLRVPEMQWFTLEDALPPAPGPHAQSNFKML